MEIDHQSLLPFLLLPLILIQEIFCLVKSDEKFGGDAKYKGDEIVRYFRENGRSTAALNHWRRCTLFNINIFGNKLRMKRWRSDGTRIFVEIRPSIGKCG